MSRTLLLCGFVFLAVRPIAAPAATPNLTGSWQFVLTPTTPVAPTVNAIPGLATFTSDGSVIETDGSEFVSDSVSAIPVGYHGTPGHGIWQLANTPVTLYVQYISLILQPNGALFAKNITTMFLTMSSAGNQFSGSYTTDQVTGSSTRVVSSGNVSGQLIPHVALP